MGAASTSERDASRRLSRENLGFLLAKAAQRWNELLADRFATAGYRDIRPSYGSLLLPLFEEDGLRMGELARRARLSKQTMTTMIRLLERDGLVKRRPDPNDARAQQVFLSDRAREFEPVAANALAQLDELVALHLSRDGVEGLASALRTLADLER